MVKFYEIKYKFRDRRKSMVLLNDERIAKIHCVDNKEKILSLHK